MARVFSLSIRLFANLLAGHALMKIIGTFVWSTPLIAAALITGLRPIASTRDGLAESFAILTSQLKNYWSQAVSQFNDVLKQGDMGLNAYGVGNQIGFYEAVETILSYTSTVLVVFSAVGVMLYIAAYYLHSDLNKSLIDHFPNLAKNSVWFKVVWMFYGERAWMLSCLSQIKPAAFSATRNPGVLGMLLFVWASFKHSTRYLIDWMYSCVARGTVVSTSVSWKQISSWNTYVAPVLSPAFWWFVVALILTGHYLKLVQYLGFAQATGISFSWGDVFTSSLWTFGPFGVGLFLSFVLVFAMLADFACSCWSKTNPNENSKVGKFFTSSVWFDTLAAIFVGLTAGWVAISSYYTLFDLAFASLSRPASIVFGSLVRLAHWVPLYGLVTIFFAVVFTMIADLVTNSMNADENRSFMKILWMYAPTVVLGIVLFEMLYWGLVYDVLFAGYCESLVMKIGAIAAPSPYWSDIFGSWAVYQAFVKASAVSYIDYTNLLFVQLSVNGYNPIMTILGGVASGVYVFVTFLTSALTAVIYYAICEIDAVLIAGLNSIVALIAVITLPLITPLAWTFLLAITGLELAIALLQAYVFITLSSMYLNDVIKLH